MRFNPAALLMALIVGPAAIATSVAWAETDAQVQQLVSRQIGPMVGAVGGVAVAIHVDGRTLFFNYGMADSARAQPVSSDSLFNLASVGKVFVATLLAQAVKQGEVALGDPVAKYVTELQRGGDIRKVTLGELASHTSGLPRTPQEPGHRGPYALPDFIRYLVGWKADRNHQPGKQDIYSNAAFALLQLALQRRFDTPAAQLMEQRLLQRLGMSSTTLPVPGPESRGEIATAFIRRAVQGYGPNGNPVGEPGDERGAYDWPGTGQLFSSARDMATFMAANLGALPDHRPLQDAMAFAQQGVFTVGPRFTQGLAWQRVHNGDVTIVDKNGGLDNTSTYIGMIPQKRLGIVILANRGKQPATKIGRQIILSLAGHEGPATDDGNEGD
jgi:beta-lactamase class C